MPTIGQSNGFEQHSLWRSFFLHVVPGALVTGGFVLGNLWFDSAALPSLAVFLAVVLVVDIPVMLGIMLTQGKRQHGRYTLEDVVGYREKLPWKTFLLMFIGAFVVLYLLIVLSTPAASFMTKGVFAFLPGWFFMDEVSQYDAYSKSMLMVIFTLHLLITGILLPIIEELYFRGYLLPRIARFGFWSPVIGALFFGLYHSWQLYGFVGIVLLGLGLGIVVWWKKDIRLSISLHVLANTMARLFILVGLLMQ